LKKACIAPARKRLIQSDRGYVWDAKLYIVPYSFDNNYSIKVRIEHDMVRYSFDRSNQDGFINQDNGLVGSP
jgi:hypothetical protein